jgi:hypothetical protein
MGSGINMTGGETGAKIMANLAARAQKSKIWAGIEHIVNVGTNPKAMGLFQGVLGAATTTVGITYSQSILRRADITKEQGQLEALLNMVTELIDVFNQAVKQANDDLKSKLQIAEAGNERVSEITQPIAYAASIMLA